MGIAVVNAPFGSLIAYHYGHLFISSGNYLYYSEKFQYERWNANNFYGYDSAITAVLPCNSGLWIGTESSGLFWLGGKSPSHGIEANGDFEQSVKHSARVYQGSACRLEAEHIGDGSLGWGWIVTSAASLMLLLDGGQCVDVSHDFINLPAFDSCAGALINDSDSYRYVAIIKGAKVPVRSI